VLRFGPHSLYKRANGLVIIVDGLLDTPNLCFAPALLMNTVEWLSLSSGRCVDVE
jgi:hypothetical protein